jgi:hypothetical protein
MLPNLKSVNHAAETVNRERGRRGVSGVGSGELSAVMVDPEWFPHQ